MKMKINENKEYSVLLFGLLLQAIVDKAIYLIPKVYFCTLNFLRWEKLFFWKIFHNPAFKIKL